MAVVTAHKNSELEQVKRAIGANVLLAVSLMAAEDPKFAKTRAEIDALLERIPDRTLLLRLEEAINAHVNAAEDAVTRVVSRERGSIPVAF